MAKKKASVKKKKKKSVGKKNFRKLSLSKRDAQTLQKSIEEIKAKLATAGETLVSLVGRNHSIEAEMNTLRTTSLTHSKDMDALLQLIAQLEEKVKKEVKDKEVLQDMIKATGEKLDKFIKMVYDLQKTFNEQPQIMERTTSHFPDGGVKEVFSISKRSSCSCKD